MNNKGLVAVIVLLILAVILISGPTGVSALYEARAGPKRPTWPTPTPTAKATVTPSPFPTPIIYPTEMQVPTIARRPTSIMDDGIRITADYKIRACMNYVKIVVRWIEMEKQPQHDFHNLTLENVPLIMAVMVAESGCNPYVESSAGAIGLMQVIPRPWLPNVSKNGMNVYTGMYILDRSINLAKGDIRLALAYYNCGVPGVEADECGSKGGLNYADNVLQFWLPLIETEMND